MRKPIYALLALLMCLAPLGAAAQADLLQSGPMVGYSDMREVMLWAQTTAPANVYIEYWEQGKPTPRYRTSTVATTKDAAYTAHMVADKVLPGKKYDYELFINGKKVARPYSLQFQSQTLWQWRTDPPAAKIVIGSCFYDCDPEFDRPGNCYGDSLVVFKSIYEQKPDAMLWLGDNTYLREADWGSRTGIQYRYTHGRSTPELQALLGNTHHYATWDDHDFGPNDADGSYAMKTVTLETFKHFWANPNYDVAGIPGVTGTFEWADVQFFLLDDRYHRDPNDRLTGDRDQWGKVQIEWLISALKTSKAPFKFIVSGGQVLNTALKPYLETHSSKYPEERKYLLDRIAAERISGVIFLNGDRHHSEMSMIQLPNFYPLYEITVSPLTAGPVGERARNEGNSARVEGTYYGWRNFGVLEVAGPRTDRVLKMTLMNNLGKPVWTREIKAKELQFGR